MCVYRFLCTHIVCVCERVCVAGLDFMSQGHTRVPTWEKCGDQHCHLTPTYNYAMFALHTLVKCVLASLWISTRIQPSAWRLCPSQQPTHGRVVCGRGQKTARPEGVWGVQGEPGGGGADGGSRRLSPIPTRAPHTPAPSSARTQPWEQTP